MNLFPQNRPPVHALFSLLLLNALMNQRHTQDTVTAICQITVAANLCIRGGSMKRMYQAAAAAESSVSEFEDQILSECRWISANNRFTYMAGASFDLLERLSAPALHSCVRGDWKLLRIGALHSSLDKKFHSILIDDINLNGEGIRRRVVAPLNTGGRLMASPPVTLHHGGLLGTADLSQGDTFHMCTATDNSCLFEGFPSGFGMLPSGANNTEYDVFWTTGQNLTWFILIGYQTSENLRPIGTIHVNQPYSFHDVPRNLFVSTATNWMKWFTWEWPYSGKIWRILPHSHWRYCPSLQVSMFAGSRIDLGLPRMSDDVYDMSSGRHFELNSSNMRCVQLSSGVFSRSDVLNYDAEARTYFDKRVVMSCLEWQFSKGEAATAIAFAINQNGVEALIHVHFNIWVFPFERNLTLSPHAALFPHVS